MAASGSDSTSARPHRQAIGISHHYDGSGYVGNRKADMIGYWGAIGAIVDVYDAITSERVFCRPLSAEETLKRMYEWRHKDFRADLVEEFI